LKICKKNKNPKKKGKKKKKKTLFDFFVEIYFVCVFRTHGFGYISDLGSLIFWGHHSYVS
jgi:hypothetical protein